MQSYNFHPWFACDYTVEVTSLCLSGNHVSSSHYGNTSICSCRKCFFLLLPLGSGGDHLNGEMLSTFSLSLLMGVEVTKPLPLMPLPPDSGSEFGLDMIREFETELCSELLRMLAEVLSGLLRNIDGEKVSCFNFDGDFSTEDGDRNPTLRVADSSPECLRSEWWEWKLPLCREKKCGVNIILSISMHIYMQHILTYIVHTVGL